MGAVTTEVRAIVQTHVNALADSQQYGRLVETADIVRALAFNAERGSFAEFTADKRMKELQAGNDD